MEIIPLDFTTLNIRKYYESFMLQLVVLIIVIGAGFLAVWKKKWSNRHRPVLKRSTSLAVLHGGGMALRRLIDYHEARADPTMLDNVVDEFMNLFSHHHCQKPNFRELTRVAAKLEMSGKENIAIRKLEEEKRKAEHSGNMHEKYELEMILVEMYIYKGNYKEALDQKCWEEETISDARLPLYRAIIMLAQGKEEEAKKFWENFCELRTSFILEPNVKERMEEAGIYKICESFYEFKKLVERLQEDIKKDVKKRASR